VADDNDGTVESKSNQIQITGGVTRAQFRMVVVRRRRGVMVFVGSYTFGSGVGMTGAIDLVGAQIQAEDIQGPEATVGLSTVARGPGCLRPDLRPNQIYGASHPDPEPKV